MPMNPSPSLRRRPFHLVAKPTGAACNLDCSYCFFLSKEALWDPSGQRMSEPVLRRFLQRYLAAQPDGEVEIAWQGGEPTMRGLDFFRRAVEIATELKRPRQSVRHSIQTNATLIDARWARFLAENRFLVGVSIDGPEDLHDAYRVNKAGRGTYRQVVRGLRLLQEHGVETNILCTVNAANAAQPLRVYRHLRDGLGANFIQFIPIVERVSAGEEDVAEAGWRDPEGRRVLYRQEGAGTTSRSVPPRAWGEFLCAIYDEWLAHDVGRVFIQHIEVMVGAALGRYSLCAHAPECGTALAIEHNGDVYSCDHFVEPGYRLGSVLSSEFTQMLNSPEQRRFGADKRTLLPRQCRQCPVRWACNGGCPKDRFDTTADGESGQNHLCAGYYAFFTHAAPGVLRMADAVRQGIPAARVLGAEP
ncbi:radical sam [Actinomyces glycerinitolerans]|uniref:Radical sam n=2 Tax=Actinomyces glycerinitolerans TaxID=1892869 RepID=A0A1M4RV93_9ACTO|nr:radical sam [Actinomyces glycerinitolerans]